MERWSRLVDENHANVLWYSDRSVDYDVDQHAIVTFPGGTVGYVWATGCSCWDGDAEVEEFTSLAHALSPLGVPANVRDDEFNALSVRHDWLEEKGLCPVCPKEKANG